MKLLIWARAIQVVYKTRPMSDVEWKLKNSKFLTKEDDSCCRWGFQNTFDRRDFGTFNILGQIKSEITRNASNVAAWHKITNLIIWPFYIIQLLFSYWLFVVFPLFLLRLGGPESSTRIWSQSRSCLGILQFHTILNPVKLERYGIHYLPKLIEQG